MALEEQPADELFSFTDKLRKKIDEKKQAEKNASAGSDKTALIVMDIAMCAISAAAYIDYSAGGAAYETLYTAINNTTQANQKILINEKAQVEGKGTFMAITTGVAAAAVLYTLADIFIFSADNTQSLRAEIKPENEYAGLKMDWRF